MQTASYNIHTKSGRDRLKSRREQYWQTLSQGRSVGFRKLEDGRGTWHARYRDLRGQQHYKALGEHCEAFGFDEAVAGALAWFRDLDRGVSGRTEQGGQVTVEVACRNYVEDRRREKGETTSHDAHMRFARTVYGDGKKHKASGLAPIPLVNIRSRTLKEWRDGLVVGGQAKSSANRTLITLKAALNLAVRDRLVTPDHAQEWADVKPLKTNAKRRDIFLDQAQRRALLDASGGAVRDLIEAAMLTGCRPGELTSALRSAFDSRTESLNVGGKTGRRTMPLSPPAVVLFQRLAKGKMPNVHLLTRNDGKPWAHSDWDELVKEAAASAGLPPKTCLYTLRHSFITQCLLDGMSTLEVARMVGTSLQMIEKHYGHLVESTARERLAKVKMV